MMLKKKAENLALVIPTRREAGNILPLLQRIRTSLDPTGISYQVLVVDDDSRDGTADLVSSIGQTDPRVRLLLRHGERGLSGAVLHGWQHTDAPILGVMDADLQHPPELLTALITAIHDGRDLAVASRYATGGTLHGWNPARRLLSAAAVTLTRPLLLEGLRVHDPMSGFFLVRRHCIEGILFQKNGFKLLLEILVRARLHSVEEIPFTFCRRRSGKSKANFKTALDYATLLARLYRERYLVTRSSPSTATD